MRAIVTVVGKDKVGIIAAISQLLARENVNILDITQTILSDNFTMIMLVDTVSCGRPFGELADLLAAEGDNLGVLVRAQREDIFNAMHRI